MDPSASLPEPPYVAVIFSSVLSGEDPEGYAETAVAIRALAAIQPGYLGYETARNGDGSGITVSYWADEEAAQAWKRVAEHARAQARGKSTWYRRYDVRVARVERAYPDPARRG